VLLPLWGLPRGRAQLQQPYYESPPLSKHVFWLYPPQVFPMIPYLWLGIPKYGKFKELFGEV
jgi:hypothetical protein